MDARDKEMAEFQVLFERVARWVAVKFGVERVLEITVDNFPKYLDAYHSDMAEALLSKSFRAELAGRVFSEIRETAVV